jgi:hypothetical protein
MPVINPSYYLADPQVRPFMRDVRVDLTAPDVEQISDGVFVVYRRKTTKNQIEVVHSITPYLQKRTDIGTPEESTQKITNGAYDGQFAFNPLINNQTPVIFDIDFNAAKADGAASLSNADRVKRSGIAHLSLQTWVDSQRWNPLFQLAVPSETELLITFQVLPQSATDPLPNPPQIGAGANRIDFAGVMVAGVLLPQKMFDDLVKASETQGF